MKCVTCSHEMEATLHGMLTHKCPIDKKDQADKIAKALGIIQRYGGIDGEHHKTWVIDQVARALVGEEEYPRWVIMMKAGKDGPDTYDWDKGVPP
jgi:hypothetical protein